MKGLKGVSLCYRQDWDLLNNRHTAKRRPVVKRTISNRNGGLVTQALANLFVNALLNGKHR